MSVTVLVPEDLQPTVDKVNNLQQSDVAQNAKLVADEAVLSGHTQALTDLSTRVANLETKLISDEQKIADVNTRLTGVETQVSANVAAIGGLLQKVMNLEAAVSANSLKIADLTNTISPLKDQIADLLTYKNRIADLENAFPAPVMTFTADKTTVNAGESVVLSWDTKNVWRVTLNDQDAVKTGGIPVTPDKNTDYTLVAYGPKDFVVKTISITVNFPAPTLTASINPTSLVSGQPATITWATTNADKVSINNVDAPINGTQTVNPTANTDYVVVATGKGGSVNQTVSITVTQPAPTATISVAPNIITAGGSATLTWSSTNADTVNIEVVTNGVSSNLLGLAASGSMSVNPTATTNYNLSVTGPGGNATATTTLTVNPATVAVVLTDIIDSNGTVVKDIVSGGTYTLRGQNMKGTQNTSSVRVGLGTGTLGLIASIKSFTDTAIVFTVPTSTASFINTSLMFYWTVNGSWTLKGSLPLASINIVNNPPSVSGIRDSLRNPATTLNGGTTAYINGNYLGGAGTVTLAGLPVTVVKWTNTEITVSLPVVLEQTVGSVVVTRSDNQVGSLSGFTLLVSAPTATLTLNPTSMLVGASSTLTWSSSGATQVTIDPIGAVALSGSQTVAPTVNTTYNLTATGPGGVKTLSQTLTVNVPPPPPVPPPAIVGANIPHPKMDMTNINWPTHLNYTYSAVVGSNSMGFGMVHVALVWLTVPDGWVGQYKPSSTTTIDVTKQMLKDWCIKKWREKMDSIMTKWNANLNVTDFAFDSYLYCGDNIDSLLTIASWMGDALTDAEKSNMQMVVEQAVWNTWNPSKAKWGTTTYTWTGWGNNNPLNNYFYRSHWRGTMLWAIYSQSATWLDFVRNNLNPLVRTKYAPLVGGGSYEGTGYGQSYTDLFKVSRLWKDATGEDMAVDIHIPEHIEYWVRAITPDGTRYWPVGDQASGSGPYPGMRDGLKNLILWGILAAPDCPQAELGRWLLNKVGKKLDRPEQCINGCYNTDGISTAPAGDSYYASAVGHFFAKADDGSYIGIKAGPSIESHDSLSEGSIDLYLPGGWRMVTGNIFTLSGIEQRTKFYNCMWFKKADGTDILQKRVRGTTLNYTDVNNVLNGTIDSTAVYAGTDVTSCKRDFIYDRPNKKLSIHDTYTTINGATGSCKLGFNALPVLNADNSVTVGSLTLRCSNPGVVIDIADFNVLGGTNLPVGKAWYVNFSGCAEYNIEVTW